jgi:hypothetical protein
MVTAKERSQFTRQGAFFLTAATFLECYIGYGVKTWLGFGFPNQRAMKVAQHLNLYAPVGKMIELRWQTKAGRPYLATRVRHLLPHDSAKNQIIVEKLWQRMRRGLRQALVAVRDWQYMQHRYYHHPFKAYEVLLITRRFTGQALTIAIIQREGEVCHLRDFIGNPKHLALTIQQVRRLAGNWGMRQMHLWITTNFLAKVPLAEAEQHPLPIDIPHNIWSPSFASEEINNKWWLMSGDTDFL